MIKVACPHLFCPHLFHVMHDLEDDHSSFVWNVLMSFVKTKEDEQLIIEHLTNVYKLFCAYYTELYNDTIGSKVNNLPPLNQINR